MENISILTLTNDSVFYWTPKQEGYSGGPTQKLHPTQDGLRRLGRLEPPTVGEDDKGRTDVHNTVGKRAMNLEKQFEWNGSTKRFQGWKVRGRERNSDLWDVIEGEVIITNTIQIAELWIRELTIESQGLEWRLLGQGR